MVTVYCEYSQGLSIDGATVVDLIIKSRSEIRKATDEDKISGSVKITKAYEIDEWTEINTNIEENLWVADFDGIMFSDSKGIISIKDTAIKLASREIIHYPPKMPVLVKKNGKNLLLC